MNQIPVLSREAVNKTIDNVIDESYTYLDGVRLTPNPLMFLTKKVNQIGAEVEIKSKIEQTIDKQIDYYKNVYPQHDIYLRFQQVKDTAIQNIGTLLEARRTTEGIIDNRFRDHWKKYVISFATVAALSFGVLLYPGNESKELAELVLGLKGAGLLTFGLGIPITFIGDELIRRDCKESQQKAFEYVKQQLQEAFERKPSY